MIADAAGNLFGTIPTGGANGDGAVFEIANLGGGADTPVTLLSFNGADGALPYGGLIADAAGDLFGTTDRGGANGDGTVFEIVKTGAGYASTPTILASFDGADGQPPQRSARRRRRGPVWHDTVWRGERRWHGVRDRKTGGGYTPVTLVSFDGADGRVAAV